jgi:cytoskeletal protein CcmA (bactofilin family)
MNTFLINETDPRGDSSVAYGPRLAINPGVNAPSQLGSSVRIEGEIYCQEDIFVDGDVNGSMALPNCQLSIGPKANVKANIKARNVVLVGNLEGNIEASERIELRSRCSLLGNVKSPRIIVENGAFIKGTIEVIR